jgi:glycosyltransferase involved in cell wall biosynthesis
MYDAVNKGINLATGDLITILNSDDVYSNDNVISEVVKQFERSPKSDILFGDFVLVDQKNLQKLRRYYSPRKFKPWKLRFGWMPPHPGSFVKRDVYMQYGLYLQDYKIAADYEMFVPLLLTNRLKYIYFRKILVLMRLGGLSTVGILSNILLNREIVKACRSNGVYTNLVFLVFKIPFKLLEYINLPRL